ncbi:MAG: hypothetical protein FJX47_06795 [Alphaproteobacteria bacterium]|nr:hypothetical protein [Alphaproteobacteria bacterium]
MPAPDQLSLVVASGRYDTVHYALALASAAAATGKKATLFFTLGACRALIGREGWRALPTEDGRKGGTRDAELMARGAAGFDELLAACLELGVRVIVCEMGLRAEGIEAGDLRRDVKAEIAGIVTFLEDASASGGMLYL